MQRIKDEGGDPTKHNFSGSTSTSQSPQTIKAPPIDRPMTKPGINRKISVYELEAHSRQGDPWFVVKGEVRRPILLGGLIYGLAFFRFIMEPVS
jgi:nitrate reductase (NAD(P)H)